MTLNHEKNFYNTFLKNPQTVMNMLSQSSDEFPVLTIMYKSSIFWYESLWYGQSSHIVSKY